MSRDLLLYNFIEYKFEVEDTWIDGIYFNYEGNVDLSLNSEMTCEQKLRTVCKIWLPLTVAKHNKVNNIITVDLWDDPMWNEI
jgi:hypothetical protein